ncbi:ArsR/SmtB family transcription factor [Tardiphaga sp.]|uniref:ArsR/SmtB family transcription factor n=1 Tax=Tardiphaga sp. TaxID=1926292 RepID=UPI00352B95B0
MVQFVHPATKDITLAGVLSALADPIRLQIVRGLLQESGCLSCTAASPCPTIAKSTLSNHFRVLREAGLIQTSKKGVEHQNTVRAADIEARFPGLLMAILACSLSDDASPVAPA